MGGDVGPELTRVGSKVKPEWLQAWLRNPRAYDPGTAMPHYRFTDPRSPRSRDFFWPKPIPICSANVHLDAANARADRARQAPGFRLRLRFMPRNRRHQEAGKLRSRTQPHRQQAGHATRVPAGHAAHTARLHRHQDQAAALFRARLEDAAVHLHADADRCADHSAALA